MLGGFTTETSPPLPDHVQKAPLAIPPFAQLAQALHDGLAKNFEHVSVNIVDCPDLSQEPWCLAAPGICGNNRLVGTLIFAYAAFMCARVCDFDAKLHRCRR